MTALLDDDASKDDEPVDASANGADEDEDDDEESISQDEIDALFG